MLKRKIAALFLAAVTALSLCSYAYADDAYKMEEIGNISYSIPHPFTTESSSNENTYTFKDGTYVVKYDPSKESTSDLQRELIEGTASLYKRLFNYKEKEDLPLSFQNYPGLLRSFTYKRGMKDVFGKIYVIYTGEGTVCFSMNYPDNSENAKELEKYYTVIIGSVKTKRITDNQAETETESETETEKIILKEFSSGVYLAGDQVEAGEYFISADNGNGHVTISRDSDKKEIILKESFKDNTIVSVNEGEYIETAGASAVLIEGIQELDMSGNGMFEAGIHFEPGTYDIIPDDQEGYFCVYTSSKQDSIISEGILSKEITVTIEEGNILELSDCHFKEIPPVPVKAYTDKETVKKVQEKLNELGYECGYADGIIGKKTKAAVSKYAKKMKLESGEKITDEVLELLGI